jgi:hypothetical protein
MCAISNSWSSSIIEVLELGKCSHQNGQIFHCSPVLSTISHNGTVEQLRPSFWLSGIQFHPERKHFNGCIYICTNINICLYVCMHASIYLSISLSMYVCMHVCMCVCLSVCMHACMYLSIYLCMYVCMHVCVYVCMYVCM